MQYIKGSNFTKGCVWEIVENLSDYSDDVSLSLDSDPIYVNAINEEILITEGVVLTAINAKLANITETYKLRNNILPVANKLITENLSFDVEFMSVNELIDTHTPVSNKFKQDKFIKRFDILKHALDSIWK